MVVRTEQVTARKQFSWLLRSTARITILVGRPGAGKTTFFEETLKPLGFIRISNMRSGAQDTISKIDDVVQHGHNVAVGTYFIGMFFARQLSDQMAYIPPQNPGSYTWK